MPNYRNNQFVSDWLKPQQGEWQNAPYQYPRRVVRTSNVDASGNRVTTATQLDRGFMRNLLTETASPSSGIVTQQPRQRFNFQFNPSAIQQEVQMRQDIYLPILQDPVQFAQPMSAVATFNFDLLIDRTMEVGSSTGNRESQTSPEERRFISDTDVFGETNPANDVYQIGVLSDLQVLYSIIGQGFSKKFIESQLEQLKVQARQEALGNEDSTTTEADIDSITSDQFSSNLGNNAFLIPMPVRIVFSELFMVDGFVTSTSVRFTKFNTSMVPTQASIGLSMNALYIGFARKDTFLTVQLENAKNIQITNAQTAIAEQAEIVELARQSANEFVFYCDKAEEWIDMLSTTKDNPRVITEYLRYAGVDPESSAFDREFKVGFKDAKRLAQSGQDKIENFFKDGGISTFSYNWRFIIYGPYESSYTANIDFNRNKSKSDSTFASAVSGVVKCAEYYSSSNPTATDLESWKRIRSDSIRSHSGSDDKNDPETFPVAGEFLPGGFSDYSAKYFVVHLFGSVSAGSQTREFNNWKVLPGYGQYTFTTSLGWPTSMGMGGNPSGVTGTNYAENRSTVTNESGRLTGGI